MRLGFVYDSRDDYRALGFSDEATAEFDSPETIAAVSGGLARLGATVVPVGNGRALASSLSQGARYDLVFSIAEGLKGRSREAQVPALCELFDQPYVFSDPLTMAATLDKAVAKTIVAAVGVATARHAVLHSPRETVDLPYPLFVKPLAEGTGKGCEATSKVATPAALAGKTAELFDRFGQPVLVERYLPGREFTAGIVGTGEKARLVAVMEIVLKEGADEGAYSYRNKEECERLVSYRLARDAEAQAAGESALAAYRALSCRDAARLDFRSDEAGVPHFLEANPIAGLHPTHSDLPILTTLAGKTYDWLLAEILASAAEREKIAWGAPAQRARRA